jgi:hypothetical protein
MVIPMTSAMTMSIATARKPMLCNILTATVHAMSMSIATVKKTTIHILQVSMSTATVKSTTIHILQWSMLATTMIMSTSITAMLSSHLRTSRIHTTAMTMSTNMTMGRLRNQRRTAIPRYSTTTAIAATNLMGRRRSRLPLSQFKKSLSPSVRCLMRITSSITSAATTAVMNTRWKTARTI